ncbi:polysaccharide deacetylase family protein [Kamptonema sp. UHCC 0994]|uniref:polysaccharide deacetylase family protein n=1 Tax=Kamptonema sp. UHCC 0994 TaxID=3031329 RepID=UPI0023B99DCE|nr:polysaccharide deacetylase family protein [Kamptonema sp. UHCC 0994]MDF0552159.1 polysaccharide deacetylase family protein [Kamptonema sp. UHCC 0994]
MALAPIFPVIHPILKRTFPNCLWTGDVNRCEIALTFDDGPHPQHTPQLLKVLDKYNIKASFFVLGLCVQRYPQIAKSIYEKGHWIGLHGYQHISFPKLTPTDLKLELENTQNHIYKACSLAPQLVRDVRPPNGLFTPRQLDLLTGWGYRPVMWSVVPEDWVRPGVSVVVNRVIQQACSGSIIVLHDGHCGGEDVALSAAEIIPLLLDRGYNFVTIDKIWNQI